MSQAISTPLTLKGIDVRGLINEEKILFNYITMPKNFRENLEFLLACILLLIFSPVMLMVASLIKLIMGGPVFYTQVRVGENGKHFSIIKFRTMVENAEAKTGPMLSVVNDSRVTGLGRFLRASHLDELPQLFNVLKGEMSFVGPRPERPCFVEKFEKEIDNYTRRREVKPGITGFAQICLPYDATADQKIIYDLFYIENQFSLLFYFLISYYTAIKMLTFFKYIR